jgi:predicted O-methyltransferase YrrM
LFDDELPGGAADVNPVLEEILRTGRVATPAGGSVALWSNVSPGAGAFLQGLVERVQPEQCLEVGLAQGLSALYLCDALEKAGRGRHIAIDPNQHGGAWGDSWEGAGLHSLERAGYAERVEFHGEPSFRVLPRLEAEGLRLDLAFIDGWHTFDFSLVDFFYIDRMLRPGGVVAIDDAQWPSVRKLCRYLATNRAYRVIGAYVPDDAPAFRRRRWLSRLGALARRSASLRALLRPEWITTDPEIGIPHDATCLALEKTGDDDRGWDHHREF